MVQQDSGPAAYDRLAINWDYGDPLQADYDALNRRIAALQKQIVEKQIEAGWKLQELRRALRLEQANLIRISDRMNLERRRNLALHLTMDDSAWSFLVLDYISLTQSSKFYTAKWGEIYFIFIFAASIPVYEIKDNTRIGFQKYSNDCVWFRII